MTAYVMTVEREEMCARCGIQMTAGDVVADVDTPDRDVYPWSVADWGTVHAGCVACPWSDADECAMAAERSVAGTDGEIAGCADHGRSVGAVEDWVPGDYATWLAAEGFPGFSEGFSIDVHGQWEAQGGSIADAIDAVRFSR